MYDKLPELLPYCQTERFRTVQKHASIISGANVGLHAQDVEGF
jgi:hypothetical protein